jgi:hypothetical protein
LKGFFFSKFLEIFFLKGFSIRICGGEEKRICHRHGLVFTYTAQKVVYISKNFVLALTQRQDFGFYYSAVLAFNIKFSNFGRLVIL